MLESNTFLGLLKARDHETPKAIALKYKTSDDQWLKITWSELYRQSLDVASGLRRMGVTSGARVAIHASNGPRWEVLFYGCQLLGAIVVGIERQATNDQKIQILKTAAVQVLAVETRADLDSLPSEIVASLHSIIEFNPSVTTTPELCPIMTWEKLSSPANALIAPAPAGSGGMIVFTSGTTGEPKALWYSQAQVLQAADAILDALGNRSAADRLVCVPK